MKKATEMINEAIISEGVEEIFKLDKESDDYLAKVNKIQGIDFLKCMKELVEVYNERKDFQGM